MNGVTDVEAMGAPNRACPVCGETANEFLYRQRFAAFGAGSITDGYEVVACSACGAIYASGLPDEARFAAYYRDSSKYDLGGSSKVLPPTESERFAGQASFLAEWVIGEGAALLDVGTATGGFLNALRAAGFTRLYGVDPSPDAVRVAREVNGHDVRVGGLDAASSWGHLFDLVTYVAVLEHVLDPRAQVRNVAGRLAQDGYLFISVPDASAFAAHARAPFQEFSVEHINYFTPTSLDNTLGLEGFRRVAMRQIVLPLGSDAGGPAIEAIYRRTGGSIPWTPDADGRRAIAAYVEASLAVEAGIAGKVAEIAKAGKPIYIWGTGTHTLHLLECSQLAECEIVAFIDSNPHYTGSTLAGRPVVRPSSIEGPSAPILVSSAVSQGSIAEAARQRFGDDVPLILLYE